MPHVLRTLKGEHMNHETAKAIYAALRDAAPPDLLRELILMAGRYAGLRVLWAMADLEGRRGLDSERTRAHNAFIDQCNILGRAAAKTNQNTIWRTELGEDRKEIGDFACHLACIVGIQAR